ncbi:RNB domain-containing ribonuclease [bacterium]|nr:RNB domain-containing ribonuclease [bacterium]
MEHQYCVFYKNDRLQFGWIKEIRKNKLVVVPGQGKEFNCAPSRVEYIWKGKTYEEEKEALSHLLEKSKWAIAEADNIELDIIHELCETEEAYTLDELAENFLDNHEDGWMRVALLIKLKEDEKLFQQKKNQFFARKTEEIQEILNQENKRKQTEERQVLEQSWAEELIAGQLPSIDDLQMDHWTQFLSRLKNFVIYLEKSQERDYFCALFHCQMRDSEKLERNLLEYLAKTGDAISWGKLIIKRSSVDFVFEKEELEEASELIKDSIWQDSFGIPTTDLRNLEIFSVDNEDTKDFDDALNWEETEYGANVRVFIADVASFVDKDSVLFDKASERIASLYTLKEIFPMFPPSLSEGKFSLVQAEERAALTFEFKINHSNEIVESKIYRSIINIRKNCSYKEIDLAIESQESFWPRLWSFCKKQAEIRKENGSLELDRFDVKLDISSPDQITIKSIRQNTPAGSMIQELAILVNHLAASYAKENNLPCLFRNQPPYSITRELEEDEKLSLNDINIQPARVSLTPEGHSALGLDCYMQISSPIRRFVDLINQTMIMASMGGKEVPFTNEQLLEWAKRGDEIQREFNQIERKLLDHWKIKYLEQNQDISYDAQLVRTFRNGKAQVNLLDLQLYSECTLDEGITKDAIFKVKVVTAESRYNRVVVSQLADENIPIVQTVESEQVAADSISS